jgi:hypothetical protein
MRKNMFRLSVIAIVVSLVSCGGGSGSGLEADVRKMAKYRCDLQKLMAKDQSDPKVQKEMTDIEKDMNDFGNKMEAKYKDKKGDKAMEEKADQIMKEEMSKCK